MDLLLMCSPAYACRVYAPPMPAVCMHRLCLPRVCTAIKPTMRVALVRACVLLSLPFLLSYL